MRYFVLLIIFVFCSLSVKSQNDILPASSDTLSEVKTEQGLDNEIVDNSNISIQNFDYKQTPEWKKYLSMRAAGYSCLGVGIAGTITAFIVGPYFTVEGSQGVATAFFAAGMGLTLIGIPLLLAANRNKYKAMEKAFTLSTGIIVTPKENIPALSVRMKFKTP